MEKTYLNSDTDSTTSSFEIEADKTEWRQFIVDPPCKENIDWDEDAEHWFQKLPKTYEGRAFYKVNDYHNGFGKQEWASIWSPYKMAVVDGQEYLAMDVFEHIVSVPDTALAVTKKATEPSMYYLGTQFYKVDRKTNTMLMVGIALGKSTQPRETYKLDYGKHVTIAGWKMQETNSNEQLKFTDDHQVMISSADWDDGDITQSIRVLFAQPALEQVPLCPLWSNINKRRTQSPEDVLAKKVQTLIEFMNCTFLWGSRDDNYGQLPEVKVKYHFKNLDRLDTIAGLFEAGIAISLEWPITYFDFLEHVGSSKEDKIEWTPEWEPPTLKVINAVNDNSSQSSDYVLDFGKTTIQQNEKGHAVAVKSTFIKGEFFESLELESYPFDYQPLTISLQTGILDIDKLPSFLIESDHLQAKMDLRVYSSEWMFHKYIANVDHGNGDEHHQDYHCDNDWGQETLQLAIVVKRKSLANVIRVIVMNGLFAALCLVGFLFPRSDASDRVSLGVTLLLTATAYSLVIAQDIPKLGYLTFSDKYIYTTFGYIFSLTVQFGCLQFATESIDTLLLVANSVVWCAYNLAALIIANVMQHKAAKKFKDE